MVAWVPGCAINPYMNYAARTQEPVLMSTLDQGPLFVEDLSGEDIFDGLPNHFVLMEPSVHGEPLDVGLGLPSD